LILIDKIMTQDKSAELKFHSSIVTLGVPRTVGELRQMLSQYKDDTPLEFRGGPRQTLYVLTYEKDRSISLVFN